MTLGRPLVGPAAVGCRVSGDGHLSGFEQLVCVDDSEAIERAKRLVDGHDVELCG
jgi:hypothetical protein